MMKKEYEQPRIEILVLCDEKIMLSSDHDNHFSNYDEWEDDFDL